MLIRFETLEEGPFLVILLVGKVLISFKHLKA